MTIEKRNPCELWTEPTHWDAEVANQLRRLCNLCSFLVKLRCRAQKSEALKAATSKQLRSDHFYFQLSKPNLRFWRLQQTSKSHVSSFFQIIHSIRIRVSRCVKSSKLFGEILKFFINQQRPSQGRLFCLSLKMSTVGFVMIHHAFVHFAFWQNLISRYAKFFKNS